jgi:hypothetical protein
LGQEQAVADILREEHIRVHEQDQALLNSFRAADISLDAMMPGRSSWLCDYEFLGLEESLLQFILEKIVVLREIPLMEARNFGERKMNNTLIAK